MEIKTSREIDLMRIAGKILHGILEEVAQIVNVGTATIEIDNLARELIEERSAKPLFLGYRGYPATACVSINEQIVHGIPSERILKHGDLVSIDLGLQKDGYCADKAITIAVGQVSQEHRQLVEVTKVALDKAIEKMRTGSRLGDVGNAVEEYVTQFGYSVVREYTGHGIGRVMHEGSEVPNFGVPGTGARLHSGMTFAIEPMVNVGGFRTKVLGDNWTVVTVDGSFSAHFEQTVLVTDNGPEILT